MEARVSEFRVSEIKCLMCGHVAGYSLMRWGHLGPVALPASRSPLPPRRCPRCSGPLYLDPSSERPREFGIDESSLLSEEERREAMEAAERHCISCGRSVQRAERCRRCYLRHRYATNPAVREKQLALQAAWRRRQAPVASTA